MNEQRGSERKGSNLLRGLCYRYNIDSLLIELVKIFGRRNKEVKHLLSSLIFYKIEVEHSLSIICLVYALI